MKQTNEIEEVPIELLSEPLDWFFAEHYRHRQLCSALHQVDHFKFFRIRRDHYPMPGSGQSLQAN